MILLGTARRVFGSNAAAPDWIQSPDHWSREKGKAMPGAQRRCLWRSLSLAVATYAAAYSATDAKESSAFVKDAEHYFASGSLEAAEIELTNATRQSPKDPAILLRLSVGYSPHYSAPH